MYPLILGLTSLDVLLDLDVSLAQNARANTFGSTIGVSDRSCQYLEPDFFCENATVIH
jgi:hypothetical protein